MSAVEGRRSRCGIECALVGLHDPRLLIFGRAEIVHPFALHNGATSIFMDCMSGSVWSLSGLPGVGIIMALLEGRIISFPDLVLMGFSVPAY